MEKSEYFEPIIALTISDVQTSLSKQEQKNILEKTYKYFHDKNMKCVYAYDFKAHTTIALSKFKPQIVFYQQPYRLAPNQDIRSVSKYALTCYIPYYLPNHKNLTLDCEREFHRNLYRFYVLNEEIENIYKQHIFEKFGIKNSNITAIGHTMLDNFYLNKSYQTNQGDFVIYAPHWSIHHPNNDMSINLSTFNSNGKLILEYAKQHPEIKWVFKPHPTLKTALKRIGWTDDEINNYYSEWEKIGISCYTADYLDLFKQSKALITDCGSFLLEYFCTGKPLIHLKSAFCQSKPYPFMQEIFDTFYQVKSNNELYNIFDEILLKNNDPLIDERNKLLNKNNLTNNYTAQKIIDDLYGEIFK